MMGVQVAPGKEEVFVRTGWQGIRLPGVKVKVGKKGRGGSPPAAATSGKYDEEFIDYDDSDFEDNGGGAGTGVDPYAGMLACFFYPFRPLRMSCRDILFQGPA